MAPTQQTPSPDRGKGFLCGLVAALAFAACTTTAPTTPTPQPTPTPPDYPRTLVDDEGTTVEVEARPEKIISLSPAFTEIVFALGAGDRLVGGTDFDDFPPEAAALPDVATFNGVIVERVVEQQPDIILAGGNNLTPQADVTRLRELGFDVLVTYPPTLADVLGDITLIGRAIGADEEAATLTGAMQERIDEVTTAVAGLDRPRVFYEIGYQPEIYGPAPDSFVADMIELAGGEAITTSDPAVFSIALEALVDADPEVIVLGDAAYEPCPLEVAERPGWEVMTAVQNSAVRPVNDLIVTRPGPRIAEGLAALALAIHPDAAIGAPEDPRELCPV